MRAIGSPAVVPSMTTCDTGGGGRDRGWRGAAQALLLIALPLLFAGCSHQEGRGAPETALKPSTEIVIPAEGLLPAEREALECIRQVHRLVVSHSDIDVIHQQARRILSGYWRDLSSSELAVELRYSGDKDRHGLAAVTITARRQQEEVFLSFAGGMLHAWITEPIAASDHAADEEVVKLCADVYPQGRIARIGYTRGDGLLIRRIVEWSEDGSLRREETLDTPRQIQFRLRKGTEVFPIEP